jgi:hypothetical protein
VNAPEINAVSALQAVAMLADSRDHGLTVKETMFEFLLLHAVAEINPIPQRRRRPSGGLNTKTSTVPGGAMSVAVM